MLTLKKIAITGGVATGKSTVCKIFSNLGSYVVNADEIVHQLLSLSTPLGKKIVSIFGSNVIVNNEISREEIAKKVFDDPKKLKTLEQLLHPYVLKQIKKLYNIAKKEKKYSLFVVEMPLLFEIKQEKNFDYIITIAANEKICKNRFSKGPIEYERRKRRQLSQIEKQKRADYVITNNNGLKELEKKIKQIYLELNLT